MAPETLYRKLGKNPSYREALALLRAGEGGFLLSGLTGSAPVFVAAGLFSRLPETRRLLLVTPGVESAERAAGECATLVGAENTVFFPFCEVLPGEKIIPPVEITGQRLQALHALEKPEKRLLVIAPVQAVISPVMPRQPLAAQTATLETGASLERAAFLDRLLGAGYERVDLVGGPGETAVRGGIIDFFPAGDTWPVRVELAGSRIVSLRRFDPSSQLSRESVDRVVVLPFREKIPSGEKTFIFDYLATPGGGKSSGGSRSGPASIIAFIEPARAAGEIAAFRRISPGAADLAVPIAKNRATAVIHLSADTSPESSDTPVFPPPATGVIPFRTAPVSEYSLRRAVPSPAWSRNTLCVFCRNESQGRRLREVLKERGLSLRAGSRVEIGFISEGFSFPGENLTILSDSEIFGRYRLFRPGLKPFFRASVIADPSEIRPGDYVVHLNEGIGRFLGIGKIATSRGDEEVLRIEYADGVILSLPVAQINLVHRFAGSEKPPRLSRLGSRTWLKTRERARQSIRDMASDLIRIYQGRRTVTGNAFPADTPWQKEFEAEFVWEETPDQAETIREVKADLQSPRPMDRLVCGDVGYGKTEVAMRAAFKVAESGRQVALLCPTTILCQQHLHTFRERFADYPMVIENLSRFRDVSEQKRIIGDLAAGKIDIIIGTHRLLSRDIRFRDLGLWVVDEEQRFGVVQKEKLRASWPGIDILTLTATPIPRTMQLSLGGIRALSVIETAPAGRQEVVTAVSPWNRDLIVNACRREMERDGQVFFVHNRVHDIGLVAAELEKMVPEAEIAVCHGQMDERELAAVMELFLGRRVDILVATTIIESGLDIPNANTIIINDSHHFGLAELYQLRGRVGRYRAQAYCYLLYRPGTVITGEGRKRLRALEEFQRLGSGFRLALADLEIRGAGNLLGREQHGFIEAIGFYLYSHLFREAVAEMTGTAPVRRRAAGPVEGTLSEEHIPPPALRLSFYRRLFGLSEDADALAGEMADRFGPLPEETRRLLDCFSRQLPERAPD